VIVEQPGGHKVLIVQAYAYSKYVGNITVWFDEQGEYTAWEGAPILLDNTVPEGMITYTRCLCNYMLSIETVGKGIAV